MDAIEPLNAAAGATERLHLADWRRRIFGLYGEVRELAATDPARAWNHWRATREQLYRGHPSSPVPETARGAFTGRYFGYDPGLRFELAVVVAGAASGHSPASANSPTSGHSPASDHSAASGSAGLLPISVGRAMAFDRIGYLDVPFDSGVRRLTLFWLPEYAGGLFLPFRDGTNGTSTYGGGRYLLDSAKGADLGGDPAAGTVVVDFNFAFQPSCAFDPRWSCPLSPPDNRLDVPIAAGERVE
jgi:uncharacterized protein